MIRNLVTVLALSLTLAGQAVARDLPDFTELAEKQGPAVVNISITQTMQSAAASPFPGFPNDEGLSELFRRFGIPAPGGAPGAPGAPQQEYKSSSLGSGFIISSDGYVLTNAHVVSQADEVIVKLHDKREFKARIIGSDKRTDVALLKIEATGLPKVTTGDPSQLKVGEWVAAIGSPFGLENTMTAGIVSAKGRALPQENFVPFIQTDVAINPGNSGGPLFNLRGEVVGINSQIYSRSGGSVGLSFAIPIDVAIDISNQLKASGKITRGWLGIAIQEMNAELAESFGMKGAGGALVAGIEKGSPAEKGGLEPGDVILKFDGKPITTSSDLPRAVAAVKPGKTAQAEVLRKGAAKTLNITVGNMPDAEEAASAPRESAKPEVNRIGLILRELTPQQKKQLNGQNGLLVIDAQGVAAQAGIRRGDVVLGLNNTEVVSLDQFNKQLAAVAAGKSVALLIKRGENTLYVPIKVTTGK
ncbi:DegQ family serine endoprotease [Pseudomethylobacillus aquaticus]|uniref:Probable periplasmic serine endoprotease DegP-like n=1 Tax=Pseudomethylobacillus aquaticus TaxID=2676064 RepID=A0A3N0V6T5_9PROT|nr:DegQ family serine endoprotease [Pseudomethylobacillus aquaticus]ROH88510.1 DegQ family serine endoprotease [Pseudomethylobacillus aquaticus]